MPIRPSELACLGVPVFRPSKELFEVSPSSMTMCVLTLQDFTALVAAIRPWGEACGMVKIIPPLGVWDAIKTPFSPPETVSDGCWNVPTAPRNGIFAVIPETKADIKWSEWNGGKPQLVTPGQLSGSAAREEEAAMWKILESRMPVLYKSGYAGKSFNCKHRR